MTTYPPTTVTFVRGAGSLLWDDTGPRVPRLPVAAWP